MKHFYCYSENLKNFLCSNNQKFIAKEIHKKTQKKFWVFVGTEELNKLLTKWKESK